MIVIKYKTSDGSIEYFGFDATLKETTTLESDITENPVETGVTVTDHVREKPMMLSLEIIQTDFPLTTGSTAAYNDSGNSSGKVGNDSSIHPSVDISNREGARNRHIEAVSKLDRLRKEAVLLEVLTKYGPYKNMLIQSIELPRDSSLLDAAHIMLKLKQIKTVELVSVLDERPKIVHAKRKSNGGNKTSNEVNTATDEVKAEKVNSILLSSGKKLGLL